jgi:large subunit ribosomal protein L33
MSVEGGWSERGALRRFFERQPIALDAARRAAYLPPPSILYPQPCSYMPRDKIILACSDCKNRNYFTTKNKRLHPERVEWKKYCPRCNTHKVHKETK